MVLTGLPLDYMKTLMVQLSLFHALSYYWVHQNHQGGAQRWMKDFWPLARKDLYHTET